MDVALEHSLLAQMTALMATPTFFVCVLQLQTGKQCFAHRFGLEQLGFLQNFLTDELLTEIIPATNAYATIPLERRVF